MANMAIIKSMKIRLWNPLRAQRYFTLCCRYRWKVSTRNYLLINSGTAATSRLQWYIISACRPFKLSTQPPLSSLYYSLTNGQKWPVETVIAVYTTAICCICRSRLFPRLFTWYVCLIITAYTLSKNCLQYFNEYRASNLSDCKPN